MFKAVHYCQLTYLKSFETCVLKYVSSHKELDPAQFLSAPGLAWQVSLKNKVKLDQLTDVDLLLMVEKGIRIGICHAIYRYAKTNKKCMNDYDRNKELSYLKYWDVNNFYGWAMS